MSITKLLPQSTCNRLDTCSHNFDSRHGLLRLLMVSDDGSLTCNPHLQLLCRFDAFEREGKNKLRTVSSGNATSCMEQDTKC